MGIKSFVKRTHIAINWQSVAEVLIIVAKAGMSEGQHKRNIKKLPTYLTHFPGRGGGGGGVEGYSIHITAEIFQTLELRWLGKIFSRVAGLTF